ncbi:MAG TPA: YggS family pyridoxal phosphate-dependent enzyme [Actinomycetota bacterium]|nr:YggS family pyridoxal phosphate-dependent enzyme [Actinomycetota bacterium]
MTIASNLEMVRERVARAAQGVGRAADDVRLVAVSKGQPIASIEEAIAAGQIEFAENRVHELVEKRRDLGSGPTWHFVGQIQRNKVPELVSSADYIHSIDRIEVVREIDERAQIPKMVMIQVGFDGQAGRGGVVPDSLAALLEGTLASERVELVGLMAMAPRGAVPEDARPFFRRLASLRSAMEARFPEAKLQHLSMGMSQDYEVAVEEGATMVRVGEAIFGPRPR